MKETCDWTIRDGSILHFCDKPRYHKGKHCNSSTSDDGRIIRTSWSQTKEEEKVIGAEPKK